VSLRIATVVVIAEGRRRQRLPRLRHKNIAPVDNHNCCIRLPPLKTAIRIRSRPPWAGGGGGSSPPWTDSHTTTVRRRRASCVSVCSVVCVAPLSPVIISIIIIIMRRFKVSADVQTTQWKHYENRLVLRLCGSRRSRVRRLVVVRVQRRRRPFARIAAVRKPACRSCLRSWFVRLPFQDQTREFDHTDNIARRFRRKHNVQSECLQTYLLVHTVHHLPICSRKSGLSTFIVQQHIIRDKTR